jgi:hypothetical protein
LWTLIYNGENIALAPLNIGFASPAFVAFTSDGKFYFVVACIIDEQLPKLFLVQDVTSGIATLMDPAMQSTITGGVVTQCRPVPWPT